MYVEMKVKFLTFDSTSNGFVVLLMDLSNKTGLPILESALSRPTPSR